MRASSVTDSLPPRAYPYPGRSARYRLQRPAPPAPPSTVSRYRLARRVLPAAALVRASGLRTSALITVDLPTLERPTSAMCGIPSAGIAASVHGAGNELGLKHLHDGIRLSTRSRRREPLEGRVPECGIRQPYELAKALRNLYGFRVPDPAYQRDQCDTVVESPAICAAGATATVPSGSASAIFKTSSIDSTM